MLVLAENARLRLRVEELERRLGQNSSNSHLPPSTDSPADREARPNRPGSGQRRGGQPGHKGHKREFLPPDQVRSTTHCFPEACRRCGTRLLKRRDAAAQQHQVVDVPPVRPTADNYWLHRVQCACGATTCGELPSGTPRGMLGPNALALVALLVADGRMSRRKVRSFLRDVFGIRISLGALSESEAVVSDAVAPTVDELRMTVLLACLKHADATTWTQAGKHRALWVMATISTTVFAILPSGSQADLQTWITEQRGILVSDRGGQFAFWAMKRRQICWAHLLRKFVEFGERKGEAGELGRDLAFWTRLLLHAYHLARDGHSSRAAFRRSAAKLCPVIERKLEDAACLGTPGVSRSAQHILSHREAMWRFVADRRVEPTNNHAERELRHLVCWRKVCGGSQSERGSRFAANLASVIQTCRKRGQRVLAFLTSSIQAALRGATPPLLPAAT